MTDDAREQNDPQWEQRILRAVEADHRISHADVVALDRLFAREAAMRVALTDAVQVAANYYALFHDEAWGARITKWRAALGSSPAAKEQK